MTDKKKGFVPIYRSIQDDKLWKSDEPFDIRSAWIDLLLSVNHKEKEILVGRRIQVIKPGQTWTSYQKLARKWHWSYKRVLRYITLLKNDGKILADGTANGTLVTVIDWDFAAHQGNTSDTTDDTAGATPSDTPSATTGATQTIMNNNNDINKGKNVNKRDRSVCPGKGWYWSDVAKKWYPPPKEGGTWQ